MKPEPPGGWKDFGAVLADTRINVETLEEQVDHGEVENNRGETDQ